MSVNADSHSGGLADRELLTPGEVGQMLRVTPRTVARYADDGRLDRVWISPRASRYTLASVERLLRAAEKNEAGAGNADPVTTSDSGARHGEG